MKMTTKWVERRRRIGARVAQGEGEGEGNGKWKFGGEKKGVGQMGRGKAEGVGVRKNALGVVLSFCPHFQKVVVSIAKEGDNYSSLEQPLKKHIPKRPNGSPNLRDGQHNTTQYNTLGFL